MQLLRAIDRDRILVASLDANSLVGAQRGEVLVHHHVRRVGVPPRDNVRNQFAVGHRQVDVQRRLVRIW